MNTPNTLSTRSTLKTFVSTKRHACGASLSALACAFLCALLGSSLVGCSEDTLPRTQVMLVIDAESQVRARATEVDLQVFTGSGPVKNWDARGQRSLTPGKGIDWPLEAALVPKDGDADRVYLVAVIARDAQGEAIAEVRAISGYQSGKTLTLRLAFEDSCLDKSVSCNDTQSCRRGECVDAKVDADDLPDYKPGSPRDDAGMVDAGDAGGAGSGSSGTGGNAGTSGGDAQMPACDGAADCDDEDPCTGTESCEDGMCKAGTPFECEDSGDLCRPNACTNVDGEATCAAAIAEDGIPCRDGDESDQPESTCARDYQCQSGECMAQTVDTCTATTCAEIVGCDPEMGCVFNPKADTTLCDDANACTETDHCSGIDAECIGTAKDCDDAVACTVDSCDLSGTCQHTADDGLCNGPCKTGTCDVTGGCLNVTFSQDFTDCNDGSTATNQDLCYRGECLGGRQGAPTASCALGDCACSGFGSVRDLEVSGSNFVGLIETSQNAGGASCTTGTVSVVYDVTLGALTPFTTLDTANGGISEGSTEIELPYVISSTHIGQLDVTNRTVDWNDTFYSGALASQTPLLTSFRGSAFHSTGSFISTRNSYLWLWGSEGGTSRLVRCHSCSSNQIMGCASSAITCSYVMTLTDSSFAWVQPYVSGTITASYGGSVAATNYPSGSVRKRLYEDGTGKDMLPNTAALDTAVGAWNGLVRVPGVGQVLAYGSGTTNLVLCSDPGNTGDTTCTGVTGLPNQAVRSYTRADANGLATAMIGVNGSNHYLELVPSALDPGTGASWREIALSTSGSTVASAVAMGSTSFMVLGKAGSAPYVWYWGPATP